MKTSYQILIALFVLTLFGGACYSAYHYHDKYQDEVKRGNTAEAITLNFVTAMNLINDISKAAREEKQNLAEKGATHVVYIEGCHFRLDTRAKTNSVGLLIEPKRYDFQPSGDTSQSESIVIDGATMCIGYDVGMWIQRGLDIQISNVCLDYCWSQGLKVDNTIGCFSFNDSWIAGDAAGTGQFIGINLGSQPVGNKRVIRSVQLAATDRDGSIGVQAVNVGLVDLTNSQVLGGTYSLYVSGSSSMNVRDNILGGQLYFHNNTNCNVDGNRIDGGIDYQNTPKHLGNNWGANQGTSTRGRLLISMPANATSGTVSIPNPIANAKYAIVQQHLDPIDKSDVVSLSGSTITLTRSVPSTAFQIDAIIEYSIVY